MTERTARRKNVLKTVEVVLWDHQQNRLVTFGERIWRKLKHTILQWILQDCHLHLQQFRLCLQTGSGRNPDMPGDLTLEIFLRSFELNCTGDEDENGAVFSCDAGLKGLTIDVQKSQGESTVKSNVLRQWYCGSEITWNQSTELEASDELSIIINTNALLLTVSDDSIQCITSIAFQFLEYYTFMPYRSHRPKESIFMNPIKWWHHARDSVIHEINRLCSTRRLITDIQQRMSIRRNYEKIYRRYHSLRRWSWILVPFLGTKRAAVRALRACEENLSTLEIAEFRWWCWAMRMKQSRSEDVRLKLIEIYNLISAEADVMQTNEKWKIRTRITCPKVSVTLALAEDSGVCLSLNTLKLSVLSGTLDDSKYQTIKGQLDVSMSCASLEVMHINFTPKTSKGEKSRWRKIVIDYDNLWIMRSPSPRHEHSSHQKFLSINYEKPRLDSLCKRKLRVDVAPIDLSFKEKTFLQMVTFTARMISIFSQQGYYLEQLDLRIAIEEAVGGTNARLKQDAPSQQLHLEANVGDVNLRIPCRDFNQLEHSRSGFDRNLRRSHHIRRPKFPSHRSNQNQPVLVVVLGGFSLSTEINEADESLKNSISLQDSISAREAILKKLDPVTRSGELSEMDVLDKVGSSEVNLSNHEGLDVPFSTGKMYAKRLSIGFSLQVFLADLYSLGGTDIHRSVQLLKELQIQAIINSWIETSLTEEIKHILKVQLRTSDLEFYISAFSLHELSRLAENLNEMKNAISEFYNILFQPPESPEDFSERNESKHKSSLSSRQITPVLELSIRIPNLSVNFYQAFGFDDDITDFRQKLGHITISMLEIIDRVDGSKTEVNFVIRRMEVVCDNIIGETALKRDSASSVELPFIVLKPTPATLVSPFINERKLKRQMFQEWRKTLRRNNNNEMRLDNSCFSPIQFSGRIVFEENSIFVSVTSAFLTICLDNQVVDTCVAYYQDLLKNHQNLSHIPSHRTHPVNREQSQTGLERIKSENEQNKLMVNGDFGFGCVRICCSVNGTQVTTISATNLRSKAEHRHEQSLLQTMNLSIEDIVIIDHLASSPLHRIILDGNVAGRGDNLDENCGLTAHFDSSTFTSVPVGESSVLQETVVESSSSSLEMNFTNTRLVFVNRFIKDLMKFMDLALWQYTREPTSSSVAENSQSKFSMEIQFLDFHMMLPRCSWSDEFYAITGKVASVVSPVSTEYIEALKDTLVEASNTNEGLSFSEFWDDMMKTSHVHSTMRSESSSVTDWCSEACRFSSEANSKNRICVFLEQAKMDRATATSFNDSIYRLVLDGGDMFILLNGLRTEIFCPVARCVMGDMQYGLIMDFISQNYNEAGTFDKKVPPKIHPGDSIPSPANTPESLGINDTDTPTLEVQVQFQHCSILLETPDPQSFSIYSTGVLHGELSLFNPVLTYTLYHSQSCRVHILAHGAVLNDMRDSRETGECIRVISIDPVNTGDIHQLIELSSTSKTRWDQVWNSFKPVKESPGDDLEASATAEDSNSVPGSGIVFDYVIQQRGDGVESGPHVLEVVMLGAELAWPYWKDYTFFYGMTEPFIAYNRQQGCSLYAQHEGPDQWMYINSIMKNSKIKIPFQPSSLTTTYLSRVYSCPQQSTSFKGIEFCFDSTRVFYYYGGDGETNLKIDLRQFLANLKDDDDDGGGGGIVKTEISYVFLKPLDGGATIRWQSSKHQNKTQTTSMNCFWSQMCFVFNIQHDQIFHRIYSKMKHLLKDDESSSKDPSSMTMGGFRASMMKYQIRGQSFTIILEDSIDQRHSESVFQIALRDSQFHLRQDQKLRTIPCQTSANFSGALEVLYQNVALDALDPFIESWPFSFEYHDNRNRKSVTLASSSRMNILATPAVIAPLASIKKFGHACIAPTTSLVQSMGHLSTYGSILTAGKEEKEVLGKYKLINEAGVLLSYGVEGENSTITGNYPVNPGKSTFLRVDPVEKEVILPHANTKVKTQTICVTFAGNWEPVQNIVVDKVGKYGYPLRSLSSQGQMSVIVDITIKDKVKVISIHSIYKIENQTSHRMSFLVNLISRQDNTGLNNDPQKSTMYQSLLPVNGYLNPGSQTYLPVTDCPTMMVYLKVKGFNKAVKDVIRIEDSGKELSQQQGVYTCSAPNNGPADFHCCMEVQRTSLKTSVSSGRGHQDEIQEHSMIFHPVLTIQNLLPFTMEAMFSNTADISRPDFLQIYEGESVPVNDFDLSKAVKCKMKISGFENHIGVEISPSRKLKYSARPTTSVKTVKMYPYQQGLMQGDHRSHLKSLKLRMKEELIGQSRAKVVQFFCPYWILNKTTKQLMVKDRKTQLIPHLTAMPIHEEDTWAPALFPSNRSTAFIAVTPAFWSKGINLNSVGLKDSISVLEPCLGDGVSEDSEIIRPHGVLLKQPGIRPAFTAQNVETASLSLHGLTERESGDFEDEQEVEIEEVIEDDRRQLPKFSRLDFAVSIHLGPGQFDLVKVVKISPRYILYNHSGQKLQFGQLKTAKSMEIETGEQLEYYWFDSEAPQELCVRPTVGTWCYSGGFRLNEVNDFGLRIRNSRQPGLYQILKVDVSIKGDSMICVFCELNDADPPYRIENQSTLVSVHFIQKGAVKLLQPDLLDPNSQTVYAWDYPLLSHRLSVKLSEKDSLVEHNREYNLDSIMTHQPVILGRRLVLGRGIRPLQDAKEKSITESVGRSESQGQGASRVYVRVLAEGPTRIIRFSDFDDFHDPNTNDSAMELLNSRKIQLRFDIAEVYRKLDILQNQSGIEMKMMLNRRSRKKKLTQNPLSARSISHEEDAVKPIAVGEQNQDSVHEIEETEESSNADQEHNRPLQKQKTYSNFRFWMNILSCGIVSRRKISVPIKTQIPPTEQLDTLPTEEPQTNLISPFYQMRTVHPISEQPINPIDEISPEPEEARPLRRSDALMNPSILTKRASLKEKFEEWDDPELEKLTQRLSTNRKTTSALLNDNLDLLNKCLTSTDAEEMLGGELLIKVHGAEGLRKEETQLESTLSKTKDRFRRLASESVVYATLSCNGEFRRTKEVPFASEVVWDEILTFPSVPVGSYVLLTIRKRGLLNNVSLGEQHYLLDHINKHTQLNSMEFHQLDLSKSKGSNQVGRSIKFSIGWKATPLDKLTLQVKELQQDLDDLEEVLARMKSRVNPQEQEALLMDLPKTPSEVSNSRTRIGRLEVKIIEGKNLSISPDRIKNFYTSGVFGILTCERESGKGVQFKTSIAKDRLTPIWKESFSFNGVDLTSKLLIKFYETRKMLSKGFLGQIAVSVYSLNDGKPHYTWVHLQSGPENKDKNVSGEISLRLRWKDNISNSNDANEDSGISLNLTLAGFGISLIESSATKLPRELMHVLFDDLSCEYNLRGKDVSGQLKLRSMQIDNQLVTSVHPVVFAHSKIVSESPELTESDHQEKPMLEIRLEKLDTNPQLVHIRYFTFLLQEMDLVLEEDFLDLLMLWFEELDLNALINNQDNPSNLREKHLPEIDIFLNRLNRSVDFQLEFADSNKHSSKWYIEVLHIQPIKVNITLLGSPAMDIDGHSRRYRTASALGINLLDLTNFPLKINAMLMKNAFMRRGELIQQVVRHMKWQALYGLYKLLGTVELLGTPVLLGNSIMTGVASFFYEPAKGIVHGPEEFARGVATGTVHLIKNSMYGVINTLGNVTEGVGKTLAKLSLDDSYFQRFQSRPRSNVEKIVEGARLLQMGCFQGITGILVDPYQGASNGGWRGFGAGVVTGVIGIVMKPASGLLNFAASMATGIGDNIMEIGDKVNRGQKMRVRAPRDFGIHVGANATEAQLLLWKQTILKLDDGRFMTETVLDFLRQDHLVLIITDKHLMFLNFRKPRIIWCLDINTVTNVESVGLDVNVCFLPERRREVLANLSYRQKKKRINCKTKHMQQQLLLKINTAIRSRAHLDGMKNNSKKTINTSVLPMRESLRIMNTAPPPPVKLERTEDGFDVQSNSSQQLDEFELLGQPLDSSVVCHEGLSGQDYQHMGSTSGTPPLEKLRSLAKDHHHIDSSTELEVDSIKNILIQFNELAFTLLSNDIESDNMHPSKEILKLMRDLTQLTVLSKMQEQSELLSTLSTVQNLAQIVVSKGEEF
eukprot:g6040.t1